MRARPGSRPCSAPRGLCLPAAFFLLYLVDSAAATTSGPWRQTPGANAPAGSTGRSMLAAVAASDAAAGSRQGDMHTQQRAASPTLTPPRRWLRSSFYIAVNVINLVSISGIWTRCADVFSPGCAGLVGMTRQLLPCAGATPCAAVSWKIHCCASAGLTMRPCPPQGSQPAVWRHRCWRHAGTAGGQPHSPGVQQAGRPGVAAPRRAPACPAAAVGWPHGSGRRLRGRHHGRSNPGAAQRCCRRPRHDPAQPCKPSDSRCRPEGSSERQPGRAGQQQQQQQRHQCVAQLPGHLEQLPPDPAVCQHHDHLCERAAGGVQCNHALSAPAVPQDMLPGRRHGRDTAGVCRPHAYPTLPTLPCDPPCLALRRW